LRAVDAAPESIDAQRAVDAGRKKRCDFEPATLCVISSAFTEDECSTKCERVPAQLHNRHDSIGGLETI
jgi:hypothetical protein